MKAIHTREDVFKSWFADARGDILMVLTEGVLAHPRGDIPSEAKRLAFAALEHLMLAHASDLTLHRSGRSYPAP